MTAADEPMPDEADLGENLDIPEIEEETEETEEEAKKRKEEEEKE